MATVVEEAVRALRDAGARLEPGLSGGELAALQSKWGIEFCADHARLLQLGLPVGDGWVDWRDDADEAVRELLRAPVEGLLFDVAENGFWPASWGPRPDGVDAAVEAATTHLTSWPRLVPLYGHRYLPPAPHPSPAPVLSVVQSDVISFGANLLDWVRREFFGVPLPGGNGHGQVPPWSLLAAGCADSEL